MSYGVIAGQGGTSHALSVAVDGSGNTIVTGWFQGTVDFAPGAGVEARSATGITDLFVAKYDVNGQLEWVNTGSGLFSEGHGVAVDGAGNSYVTGMFSGTVDFDPGEGVEQLVATGPMDSTPNFDLDHFVAKYDAAGDLEWVRHAASSTGEERGAGIAVDGSGNSYVVGTFYGTADFDSGASVAAITANGQNHFVARYDTDGNVDWVRTATSTDGGFNGEVAEAVAVDSSGNSYVTGWFFGTVDFDPDSAGGELVADDNGGGGPTVDLFIAKYDATGSLEWVVTPTETKLGNDYGHGIAVDGSGNVYVTGEVGWQMDFDPGTAQALVEGDPHAYFLAKYDAGGNFQWVQHHDGTTGADVGQDVFVDDAGNAYATGYFAGTVDFDPGTASAAILSSSGTADYDFFVTKYDATGAFQWAVDSKGSSTGDDLGYGIAVDGSGNAFVAGKFVGTVDFDPGTAVASLDGGSGDGRFFIASYSSSGALQPQSDVIPPAVSAPDLADTCDSGASNSDNITNDPTPTFTGTAETGAVVRLVIDRDDTLAADTLAAVTVSGGTWSFTAGTLANGDYVAHALASDAGGNSSTSGSLAFTIDSIAPAVSTPDLDVLSDSGTSDSDDITNDETPTFTGTAEAGASVRLIIGADTLDPVTADSVGNWSVTADTLDADTYNVQAIATDLAGNSSQSGTLSFTLDTGAPTAWPPDLVADSDTGIDGDNITSDTSPTFEGSTEAGALVRLVLDDTGDTIAADTVDAGMADSVGHWSFTSDTLADGDYVVYAVTSDVAGNAGSAFDTLSFTIDTEASISVPDLVASSDLGNDTDNITSDVTPTFTGTGDKGGRVVLMADTLEVGAATVDGDGNWSIDADSLGDGTYQMTARLTDPAGNETTSGALAVTIDVSATAPTIDLAAASDSGASSTDNITSDPTPTFEGIGEAGDTIVLLDGSDTLGTAIVGGNGFWSIDADTLGDDSYVLRAEATDGLGNTSDSDTIGVVIDTQAPTVSGADLDVLSDSGTSSTDDITNDVTPTFTGTAEAGASIRLVIGADTLDAVTADSVGNWSVTTAALDEGDYDVSAIATDLAGNSTVATALDVTIDTTPPETTVDAAPSGTLAVDTVGFEFSSEAGASFEARLDDGSFVAVDGEHTIGGLSDGPHMLVVRAVDVAGNVDLSAETINWSVDTTVPDTFILSGPATLTGSAEADFDFSASEGGVTYEANLDGKGYAAVTDPASFTGLADGKHTLLVRATDAAGNMDTTPAMHSWTVDMSLPLAPTITGFADDTGELGDSITTDATPTFAGTAEADAIVHVHRDGMAVDTVMADGEGQWSWTDTGAAPGSHGYTAFAEDAAGNDGPLSAPFQLWVAGSGSGSGNGDDVLAAGAGAGSVDGKNGNDTLFGEAGNDTLKGGNGNDYLMGGGDQDALWGGNGNDSGFGGAGNDTVFGEAGNDSLAGGDGNDRLEGGAAGDVIDGGTGLDTLHGGDGADTLFGGADADRLYGDAMGDWIVLGDDQSRDTVQGPVAHLTGDTILGFETGKSGDVVAVTGLASKYGKLLDDIAITDGVLSLSKVGGGTIVFDDLAGPHYTDTMLGSDGSILIYVM